MRETMIAMGVLMLGLSAIVLVAMKAMGEPCNRRVLTDAVITIQDATGVTLAKTKAQIWVCDTKEGRSNG